VLRKPLICLIGLAMVVGLNAQEQPTTVRQLVDQIPFVVTPIQIWSGSTKLGSATGFFFSNQQHLFLVTNRHVVRKEGDSFYPDTLSILLHTDAQDPSRNEEYRVQLYANRVSVWKEKSEVDLVAIEISQQEVTRFVIKPLSPQWLLPSYLLMAFGEEVIVVGYPRGFSDTLHNYPISRIGAVASVYPVDFNGGPFFLVDAHLHPGTSGSPVLLKYAPLRSATTGGAIGGGSMYFLGVNSGEVNFGGDSSGLNAVWYARLVQEITDPGFHSASFLQPVPINQTH